MKKLILAGAILLSMAGIAAAADSASSSGMVRRVDASNGTVAIKGKAIDDLKIPEMTLEYKVEGKLLDGIKAGDKVKFEVIKEGNNYRITEISK